MLSSLGITPVACAVMIGAGTMIVSHVNDSGWWVSMSMFNMDAPRTFKYNTLVGGVARCLRRYRRCRVHHARCDVMFPCLDEAANSRLIPAAPSLILSFGLRASPSAFNDHRRPACMAAAVVVFPQGIPNTYFLSAFPQSPPLRRTSFPFVPFHTGKTNGIRALFSALPLC